MLSVPKKAASTAAAPALLPLWPEMYDGWLGVLRYGAQVGSGAVASLPSVSAARIAVIGRQKLKVYLASQTAKLASAWARLMRANSLASCTSELPYRCEIPWAIWFQ